MRNSLIRRELRNFPNLPGGIHGSGATPGGGGGRVKTRTAPRPYQALGPGGRSRHGPNRSCATAYRAAGPQDVAAPQDKQVGRCASPEGNTVKRPLTSFSHSNAAVRRSASTVQPNSGELRPCRRLPPFSARDPVRLQTRNGGSRRLGRRRPTRSRNGRLANRLDDPRQTLRRPSRSSFNGPVEPLPCARSLMCI